MLPCRSLIHVLNISRDANSEFEPTLLGPQLVALVDNTVNREDGGTAKLAIPDRPFDHRRL